MGYAPLLAILVVLGLVFLVHLAIVVWVFTDAKSRNQQPLVWALVTLISGLLGLCLYLIVRATLPSPQTTSPANSSPQTSATPVSATAIGCGCLVLLVIVILLCVAVVAFKWFVALPTTQPATGEAKGYSQNSGQAPGVALPLKSLHAQPLDISGTYSLANFRIFGSDLSGSELEVNHSPGALAGRFNMTIQTERGYESAAINFNLLINGDDLRGSYSLQSDANWKGEITGTQRGDALKLDIKHNRRGVDICRLYVEMTATTEGLRGTLYTADRDCDFDGNGRLGEKSDAIAWYDGRGEDLKKKAKAFPLLITKH